MISIQLAMLCLMLLTLFAFCAAVVVLAAVVWGAESNNETVQNIRVWYYKAASTWRKK